MLSNLLIKIIVLFLPTQLGLHFWPAFSRVAGIKIDYLSPTLYFLDILLIFLISLNLKLILIYLKKNLLPLGIFLSIIFLNTLFSISPLNSLFWWLRFNLYLLVFLTLRLRKLQWKDISSPLLFGTSFVVILEVLQLLFQSSLGGPLYFLGERTYSSITPGIGRFNFFGQEILRPISTFSHANSLAGYLLIVFYLFFKKASRPWHKIIPFVGIIITFSKSAIIFLAFLLFNLKPEIIIIFSLLFTFVQPFLQNFISSWQPISDRLFYFFYLKKILLQNPLTGTGLGNFIPSLEKLLPGSFLTPSKLQPVHNLIYLYLSEMGILGSLFLIITALKKKTFKILTNPLVLGLLAIVIFTGTFDHYFWTLPQNKLIFLFALAIMF
ncbi:TPA: hypothetical protein DCP77_02515 [Candidatus Collierbacteria bacterium]|uniref:O-antigen polymerase n=1 Tax=Candidatus Collierbacteria bacterium GW2011_GWA2_42_17 TaxID=1618378 RepID=A0A0G0Z3X4_9BACT|nr:MAG: hypothetical protein UU94_C0001G0058 [Candidatus Collierbacteria bacterium GW2011_GWB2_42_12]KKS43442.1 MAG: hypothetical protein UV06_C0001G0176 [Candidatus Collierbacteria bacterium GW2011_GWA2_42_17]KKS62460.1 MAG: hypothetical protein UV28_C0010G0019 [Candidatus Collierbacteria bacterium GW2011_GWE2_42_48]KKS62711.1 MAG: hypothetical protein UV29_C0011G0006 [Candidatus Collierbacteria bacterium GW2011_GWD2_42_50]KKS63232.1 MAG: hypothetical protein UV30_C0005G0005 [Candidatus Collie